MSGELIVIAKIKRAVGLAGNVAVDALGETFGNTHVPSTVLVGTDAQSVHEAVLEVVEPRPRGFCARFQGCTDRNAAEAFGGLSIFAEKKDLPELDNGHYYEFELVGMEVFSSGENLQIGKVECIHNFPTMDAMEVSRGDGATILVPLTNQSIERIDKEKNVITVSRFFVEELM